MKGPEFVDVMTAHEIGYARLTKYIQYLTKASEWLGKEFETATKRDIEVMMGRLRREGWEE